MTAEERAEYVMARFEPSDPPDRLRVLITAAVLVAENEAYERAALVAHFDCDRHGTQEIGRMILDLKHKQEQA